VVDPFQLTLDIAGNASALALPALLWAVLFLLAWEHGPFADSIGFGRKTFWLLLPGGLLATLAILPFAPVSDDWVAVSFAGAVLPILVGLLAVGRYAPPRSRSVSVFLTFLLLESAALIAIVLPEGTSTLASVAGALSSSPANAAIVLVAAVATTATAALLFVTFRGRDPSLRAVGFLGALTSAVLVLTFAGSSAVVGLGITENFPYYLIPPLGAGLVAAALAPRVFPGREGFALPVGFLSSTFGVLLGADLLRQPPLYVGGPPGLYTIGGAGVTDLVYLSGLLGLVGAYMGHQFADRKYAPVDGRPAEPPPTPVGRLVRAFRAGVRGELNDSVTASSLAAREAAEQARRLMGADPAPETRPWQGLPVPGWVVSDQANLDALARAGTADPKEGFRAWLTARFLVLVGRDLGSRRFAPVGRRAVAFLVDLALVGAVAGAGLAILAVSTPGSLDDLLSNVPFNAAVYAGISVGFLYLVAAEAFYGTTPGKALFGLAVRDRHLGRPGGLASLVRNASNLPVLTVLVLGIAVGAAFLAKAGPTGSVTVDGISLSGGLFATLSVAGFVVGGIALLGAVGALTILLSTERQRIGDVWAGTWVIRAERGPRPPAPPRP
jgi:uncharacterized RDD family membrane protein YckC